METLSTIITVVTGVLLGLFAIGLYRNREPSARLFSRLYPDSTRRLRESMVNILESKIEIFTELTGLPQGNAVVKMNVRENSPSQFQDEDIYVRAYREILYVTNFELDIVTPLNQRLVGKGVEVYQTYLSRDDHGVHLVFELRAIPTQE